MQRASEEDCMTRLEATLSRALAASPITAAERATLGEATAIDAGNAVVLGRLLRLGVLRSTERDELRKFPADASVLEGVANAELDRFDRSKPALADLVTARDAAESVLVLLGALEQEDAERRVFARVAKVDETMLLRRDEWGATAVAPVSPWLTRLAEQDASTWWLDLVALGALRSRLGAFPLAHAFQGGPRAPLTLRRSARAAQADLRVYAEVVGMEDDPARAAVERGAVIARLFDGDVEVFAIGLRADQEDLPAGLCVARASGGSEGIEAVEIRGVDPALGGKSASGWWAPLPPDLTGPQELVVRVAGREEVLALDLTS
ncbi:MAG: hypothetical protein KIT84_34635 [Labilithrix sp.]|nr:hypothetical protein [Labilithrix sp.]MCW5816186.1 hypothetical protein [Labilithrix sp.]